MADYFDRKGKRISLEEHLPLFGDKDYQVLRQTRLRNGTLISTVWLGLAHGYDPTGPLIFETMVFDDPDNEELQYRYASEEQALEHHAKLVGFEDSEELDHKLVDLDRWRSIAEDSE